MRVRDRLEVGVLLGQRIVAGRLPVLAAAVALMCATAACRDDKVPTGEAVPTDDLVFLQSNFAPAEFDGRASPGGVITVRLANLRSSAVTITAIEPVADPGLDVEYVGYSGCARVCPGAEAWTKDAEEVVKRARDGGVPLRLQPNEQTQSLMFRLRVHERDLPTFISKCVLRLRAVEVRIKGDSRPRTITAPEGESIGGLQFGGEPRPPGAENCTSSSEQPKE